MVCVLGRIPESAKRIGVLAGAFNPPTVAHLALIEAASRTLDCVVCALPRQYPHKELTGATIDQRIAMLGRMGQTVALTDAGLFIGIAREFRNAHPEAEVHFICGRDAAERIIGWDYGAGAPPIEHQLREYRLLVARRQGSYDPPAHLRHAIGGLELDSDWDEISSTSVRDWIAAGDPRWRERIPQAIAADVELIYRGG